MGEIQIKGGLEDVEFFGDVDKVNGKVGSQYPAYYYGQQTREIDDAIKRSKFNLEQGLISDKGKPHELAELRKNEEKREKIEESRPKLEGVVLDKVAEVANGLGKKIQKIMPTYSDMKRGIADAHKEYEKETVPCIELKGDEFIIAKKLGCRISNDGKVNRNDASRVWKICRSVIGEDSDVEVLRKM